MNDVDLRLLKLVQQVDEERQRRIKAEQQVNGLRAMNAQLKLRLERVSTRDAAPPPPPSPSVVRSR